MQGDRMLELWSRRRTWPVRLERLLVAVELRADEADMEEPLKKDVEFTVELIR